jgi:hypothetical protein
MGRDVVKKIAKMLLMRVRLQMGETKRPAGDIQQDLYTNDKPPVITDPAIP